MTRGCSIRPAGKGDHPKLQVFVAQWLTRTDNRTSKIIRRPWSCDGGLRMVPRALNRTTHSLEGFQMHSRPTSCGGASGVHRVVLSSEDPKCMRLRVVAGRTAPEIQCRARRRYGRPDRWESLPRATGGRRRARDVSAAMSLLMVLVSLNSSEYAAGLRSPRSEIPDGARDPQSARLHGHYRRREMFWRRRYPRIALSRNQQRLLMSQRNMGRRSGLGAAGHTTCASPPGRFVYGKALSDRRGHERTCESNCWQSACS